MTSNAVALPITGVRGRTLAVVAATAAAVAVPQLFHVAGAAAGAGAGFAQTWLPMFVPVMLVALLAGPAVGAIVGVAAPVIAYALTGMPIPAMLPLVALELVAAGVVAGLVSTRVRPVPATLAVVAAAPVVSYVALAIQGLATGGTLAGAGSTWWSQWTQGAPGLTLQLVAVALTLWLIARRTR